MTSNSVNITSVNTKNFSTQKEYVCWIDIMGTKNTMSESFEKAANFILKFHACVIEALEGTTNVTYYPLMDGIFITATNKEHLKPVINRIFSMLALLFIEEEKNVHRFLVKASLSYGEIAHVRNVDENICSTIASHEDYKKALMCGMPMIQAYSAEHTAPPFGIYIHESARKRDGLQGKYYCWAPINIDGHTPNKTALKDAINDYFKWCKYFSGYLNLSHDKINTYIRLTEEYFTDMRQKDSQDSPWRNM